MTYEKMSQMLDLARKQNVTVKTVSEFTSFYKTNK